MSKFYTEQEAQELARTARKELYAKIEDRTTWLARYGVRIGHSDETRVKATAEAALELSKLYKELASFLICGLGQ